MRCVASIALLPYVDAYDLDLGVQLLQYVVLVAVCIAVFNLNASRLYGIFGSFSLNSMWAGAGLGAVLAALSLGSTVESTDFLGHSAMALALSPVPFQEKFDIGTAMFSTHLMMHLLVNVLLAAVVEEFYFRGLLFPALAQRRTLVWSAILCSMAFAFVHLGVLFSWKAFVLSIVLLVIYTRGASLYTCIVAHAGYNLIMFLLPYSGDPGVLPRSATWGLAALILTWLWYRHRHHLRSWWIKPEYRSGSAVKGLTFDTRGEAKA